MSIKPPVKPRRIFIDKILDSQKSTALDAFNSNTKFPLQEKCNTSTPIMYNLTLQYGYLNKIPK